jgi:hypothetical protein
VTQIGLYRQALGVTAANDESADVCGPMSDNALPFVVREATGADARVEVLSLSNVQGAPSEGVLVAEDVRSGARVEFRANRVNLELV